MSTVGIKPSDDLLLKLFEDHVKSLIHKSLEPHIEQIIREEIDKAVKSMEVSLYQYYSQEYMNQQTVKIILEDKRK
jgi:hypothetical protein